MRSGPRIVAGLHEECNAARPQRVARLIERVDGERDMVLIGRTASHRVRTLVDEELGSADSEDRAARHSASGSAPTRSR
jgi:hypothetical protein